MGKRLTSKTNAFLSLTIFLLEVSSSYGSDLVSSEDSVVERVLSYETLLIAVAAIVCVVVVLVGCADLRAVCANLCPQRTTLRDFDEDGYFNDISIAAAPAVQFPMYPPVESTPESRYGSSVYFEPLPDIVSRRRNQGVITTNSARLRPRVSQVGFNRMDSEEETSGRGGSALPYYDHSQELAKLEKLVTTIRRANSRNQFPRTQLQYIKEIGSGWFGKVLEGEGQGILPGHKKTKVVVMMLKEDADQHEKLTFLQEGLPYKEVQDPNVIKLFCHCVETSPFLMILEYCPSDLKSYMRNNRTAVESFDKERLILNFACDMARGLQAMHQHNYVHRDFALRNCLITADRTVKVGDYGLSEELFKEDYFYDNNGDGIPIRWLAPEVISFTGSDVVLGNITRDSNLWSYGVTLWELVKFGTLPYTDLSNENVLRLVVSEKTVMLSKPDIPISNLDKLYQLMQRCWLEPTQRPSVRELIIMLLHLLTQTEQSDMSEFDQKWNQLMPRQNPDALHSLNPYADQNYAQSISNGTITTIAYSDGSDISGIPEVVIRPTSFGSEFSELNASLLAEAGSLQASLHSTSGTPDSPPAVLQDLKSPINEMSLAAEFNIAQAFPQKEEEEDEEEEEEKDSDEPFEFLPRSDDFSLLADSVKGQAIENAGFLEDRQNNRGGTIQLQAEVHKEDKDGEHLMQALGNVNQSFSLEFLSEDESSHSKNDPLPKATAKVEKSPAAEDSQIDFIEAAELSLYDRDKLHRNNSKNPEELFNELVTSTPKISDLKKEAATPDVQLESMSSMDQSSIAYVEDRSFMQPHKYTAYLQTVTTSVEGDDTELGGDFEKLSAKEIYLGHDADFGDFLEELDAKNEATGHSQPHESNLEGSNQSQSDEFTSGHPGEKF